MDNLLIIRPKVRSTRWQAITGIVLAAILIAGAWFTDGSGGLRVAIVVAGSTLSAALVVQRRLRLSGPQAIVATSDYFGFLAANGERRVVQWNAIQQAAHSTGFGGMCWKLQCPDGAVVLHDVGVSPKQWKRLWWRVGSEVSRRARPVFVDHISNALFD